MPIDPSRTVADLVIEVPARARVFERLGIDYCCGGKRSLAQACARRGADAAAVAVELEKATAGDAEEAVDWTAAAACRPLRPHRGGAPRPDAHRSAPPLGAAREGRARPRRPSDPISSRCARPSRSCAPSSRRTWPRRRPRCSRPSARAPASTSLRPASSCTSTSRREPRSYRMRELTGGYDLALALCNTHSATLDGLRELEADVHRHVHEENNILFPACARRVATCQPN